MSTFKVISVEESKKRGCRGKYINGDKQCKTVLFKDGSYESHCRYVTNGEEITEDLDVDVSGASATTIGAFRFLIKIGNVINPFAKISSYSNGGMIKYGEDLYLIKSLSKDNSSCKAVNLTTREVVTLNIFDVGFYIHPHITNVYLVLWNIVSQFFPEDYSKHTLSEFTLETSKVLEFVSGCDDLDYMAILSLVNELDAGVKDTVLKSLSLFTSGKPTEALECVSSVFEDESVEQLVKEKIRCVTDLLFSMDLSKERITPKDRENIKNAHKASKAATLSKSEVKSNGKTSKKRKSFNTTPSFTPGSESLKP
jgi:hypothetical protein